MKQKDLLLFAAVGIFSAIISLIASNLFIAPSRDRMQTAEVVQPFTADFIRPSKSYFNENSVNPTQLIRISPEAAGNPFDQ